MEITSIHNPKVKAWAKLKEKKYRDQTQMFLVAGEHLIQEAQKAGCLSELLVCKGIDPIIEGVTTYEVTKEILRKLTSLSSSENVIGVCHMPQHTFAKWERMIRCCCCWRICRIPAIWERSYAMRSPFIIRLLFYQRIVLIFIMKRSFVPLRARCFIFRSYDVI